MCRRISYQKRGDAMWRREYHMLNNPLTKRTKTKESLLSEREASRSRTYDSKRLYNSCLGEGNGKPLQCSCLDNPRDGGASWAAICGFAQSRTWLKRLSSSSSSKSRLTRVVWEIEGNWNLSIVSSLWKWGRQSYFTGQDLTESCCFCQCCFCLECLPHLHFPPSIQVQLNYEAHCECHLLCETILSQVLRKSDLVLSLLQEFSVYIIM